MLLLEPTTQKFIDDLIHSGQVAISALSVNEIRGRLAFVQIASGSMPEVDIEDIACPVVPTGQVKIRIVRPEGSARRVPVAMFFHGGGWISGSKETHDRLIREIAIDAGIAVALVQHTLAPESKYPTQIEEAYSAICYVVKLAKILNLDPNRLAVIGDGSGGNMAAAVTLMAKARGGPKLCCQVLFYPITDDVSDNPSYSDFENGPWLTRRSMRICLDAYFENDAQRDEITAFPLKASPQQLAGVPEAMIIVDENDVLRDEGEAYARKLTEAGVRTVCTRYNGTIHDFVMLNALAETPAARAAISGATTFLKQSLYNCQ